MDWRECTKHNIQTLKNGYKDIIYEKCPVCKLQAERDRLKTALQFIKNLTKKNKKTCVMCMSSNTTATQALQEVE